MSNTIQGIKEQMKAFRDFYGGDLLDIDEIDSCKTAEQLSEIIRQHEAYMENALADALSHLNQFKSKLGL